MSKVNTIGLITSVPLESGLILRKIKGIRSTDPSVTGGMIGNKRIVHINSGIGTANAAHATTLIIHRHAPRLIILLGIGGAYPGCGLDMEDLAVADKEVYADLGVQARRGMHGVEAIGIPLLKIGKKKYYNEFYPDRKLLSLALRTSSGNMLSGTFLTVSQITDTKKRALEFRRQYKAICENMEGAAVAQICTRYRLPMIEIRGISNIVQRRDLSNWRKKEASAKCQKAVLNLLELL